MSFKHTKSGAGEQFLLLDCRKKAPAKGICFHGHRYDLAKQARAFQGGSAGAKTCGGRSEWEGAERVI